MFQIISQQSMVEIKAEGSLGYLEGDILMFFFIYKFGFCVKLQDDKYSRPTHILSI